MAKGWVINTVINGIRVGYGHPIMDILLGISIPILEVIPNSQLLEDNHQEKCRKAVVPGAVLWMKFRNTMQEPYSHTF